MKKGIVLFYSLIIVQAALHGQAATVGQPLPAWQKGWLDIHHINTGRGSSAFFIFPDATTMLIDAGELSPMDKRTFSLRNAPITPDSSKKPFEWIAHYIQKVFPEERKPSIDYALITHFHDDHFGAWYPYAPVSSTGKYVLSGITGVAELIPVRQLIDRGYPRYDYPYNIRRLASQHGGGEIKFGETMRNYFAFLGEQEKKGMKAAQLKAGSHSQIRLLQDPKSYPTFYIQNLKANQMIWTGKDSSVVSHFPPIDTSDKKTWPDENSLSLALTLHYGPFTYYTGGDNAGNIFPGDNPLRDVETPMAKVTGEVDVATMDHHGNRDAVNELQVKTLKPRVWIGQTWSSDHPGHEVLVRAVSPHLYEGERDLFATNMLEANRVVIGPLIDRSYKSQQGHIVVRVEPGGRKYHVIILDDNQADMPVKAVFGPYESKKTKNKNN